MRNIRSYLPVFLLLLLFLPTSVSGEQDSTKPDSKDAEKGEAVYKEKGCPACHTIGGGKLSGPDLLGVTQRREEEWLREWIKSPDKMIMTDPIAKEMLKEYFVPMPNQGLTDEEVDEVIIYLKYKDSENESSEKNDSESKEK